jgi:hypothetical protein
MMSNMLHIEVSHVIDARPEELYAVIADYRVGHPAVLPKPEFGDLIVEKGGHGAGTVITITMTAYGKTDTFHAVGTEPEPGHRLVETNPENGQNTAFIFEPLKGGKQTRVTFASDFPLTPGFTSLIERLLIPPFINKLYMRELKNLANYVQTKRVAVAAS